MGGRVVLAEVEILVAHDGAAAQLVHHGMELVEVLDHAAAPQHAGAVGGGLLVGIEGLGEAQGGHLHRRDGAVGQNGDALGASLAAEAGAVGHPVVEDVPLLAHLHDGAVVVAAGVIIAVVHDVAPVGEGAGGLVSRGIGQAAALAGGVDQVVGIADLAGRAGLKEAALLRGIVTVVDHMQLEAPGQHGAHIRRIKLIHVRLFKAIVNIDPAIVVHQHTGVIVNAVVARVFGGILVGADDLEGTLGLVRDGHAALVEKDVGEQVILAVLLHHVGGVHHMLVAGRHVVPGDVSGVILVRLGVENIAVAGPVVEVVDRCRPGLQADIAEVARQGTVMGTIEVNAVAEHAGLAVGNVLPQGQDGVGHKVIPFCTISVEFVLIIPAHGAFDQPQQVCLRIKSRERGAPAGISR